MQASFLLSLVSYKNLVPSDQPLGSSMVLNQCKLLNHTVPNTLKINNLGSFKLTCVGTLEKNYQCICIVSVQIKKNTCHIVQHSALSQVHVFTLCVLQVFRKDLISAMKLPDSHHVNPDEYYVFADTWKQEWEKGVQVPASPETIPQPSLRYW